MTFISAIWRTPLFICRVLRIMLFNPKANRVHDIMEQHRMTNDSNKKWVKSHIIDDGDTFFIEGEDNKNYRCRIDGIEIDQWDGVHYCISVIDDDLVTEENPYLGELGMINMQQIEGKDSTLMAVEYVPTGDPLIPFTIDGDKDKLIDETFSIAVKRFVRLND